MKPRKLNIKSKIDLPSEVDSADAVNKAIQPNLPSSAKVKASKPQ